VADLGDMVSQCDIVTIVRTTQPRL
jgi:hypothetical protein